MWITDYSSFSYVTRRDANQNSFFSKFQFENCMQCFYYKIDYTSIMEYQQHLDFIKIVIDEYLIIVAVRAACHKNRELYLANFIK